DRSETWTCSLPAGLDKAGDHPQRAEFAQRDTRHLELAVDAARPAGDLAPVAHAHRRGVARQLGELQRRLEALLERQLLILGDRLQLGTPRGILLGELPAPVVLFDRALLSHRYRPSGPDHWRNG